MEQRAITIAPTPPLNDGRAERIVYPENPRYRRIRKLSVLMDQSIILPTGYRIGLDPLLGLLPGLGDVITALISSFLVYEAARLGLRKRVLAGMVGNIVLDAVVGAFPVLGDVFDAVWKSNMRNLKLIDRHYHPALPGRSHRQIAGWMILFTSVLVLTTGTLFYFLAQVLLKVLGTLFPFLGS
jgi:hypothetical protein